MRSRPSITTRKPPGTLKKSVRGLLVDYRTFSAAFFAAVDKEIDDRDRGRAERPQGRRIGSGRRRRRRGQPVAGRLRPDGRTDDAGPHRVPHPQRGRLRLHAADPAHRPCAQHAGMGDRDNPFHPLRYCRALGDAVDKVGFKSEERRTVVKAFDAALQAPLVTMYAELNRQLEEQGVQEVAATGFRNTVAGFRNTMAGTGRVTQAGQVTGTITGATAEQLLSALYHRMQVQPAGVASGAVPAMPPSAGAMFERIDAMPSAASVFAITGSAGGGAHCPRCAGAVRRHRAGPARVDQRGAAPERAGHDDRAQRRGGRSDQRARRASPAPARGGQGDAAGRQADDRTRRHAVRPHPPGQAHPGRNQDGACPACSSPS